MSQTPDYYATLHIQPGATRQQISRAYRALMRNHHPDMEGGRAASGVQEAVQEGVQHGALRTDASGGTPPEALRTDASVGTPPEAELLRIMQAFAVLRDPARRAAYDRDRKAEPAARAAPAPHTGTDIPVRKVRHPAGPPGNTIRITPVHWESGPWA